MTKSTQPTKHYRNFCITGVIRTTAPMVQSGPGKGEVMMMPIPSESYSYKGTDGIERTRNLRLPYVTGNSVRGRLRRLASAQVFESLAERSLRIDRKHFLSIVRGAYGRSDIAGGSTYRGQAAAATDVFAGLFGGGTMMLESKFSVSNLMPLLAGTARYLNPAHPNLDGDLLQPPFLNLMFETLMTARNDLSKLPEFDVLENAEESWDQHQAENISDRVSNLEGEETVHGKKDLRNFLKRNVMAAGVPLGFQIRVRNVTAAQAGLLLMSVQQWVYLNELGGQSSRGYGTFNAKLWVNPVIDGRMDPTIDLGEIRSDGNNFDQKEDEWATGCIKAAVEQVTKLNSESIEAVYPIVSEEATAARDEKKAKKMAGKKPVAKKETA